MCVLRANCPCNPCPCKSDHHQRSKAPQLACNRKNDAGCSSRWSVTMAIARPAPIYRGALAVAMTSEYARTEWFARCRRTQRKRPVENVTRASGSTASGTPSRGRWAPSAMSARRFQQKQHRQQEEALPPPASRWPRNPGGDALQKQLREAAREVLGTLRRRHRSHRANEDGRRPNVSAATFRERLERAVARLRAAWGTRYGNG